jgi:hypothetical protein
MIKVEQHPNFPNWQTIFAFGNIVEQVQGKANALRIAKKVARANGKIFIVHDGEMVSIAQNLSSSELLSK